MKYYIIAGEASGDLHASNLMKGLLAEDPQADFRYWGGDKMQAVGGTLVHHYKEGAVMGIVEVLAKAPKLLGNVRDCKKDILAWKPDCIILVDYPGFNMKIAKFGHEHGFKVFYYIAPKTWASREGRNRKLKKYVDKLFIVFPFEKEYFSKRGIDYVYKGNPLVDAIDSAELGTVCSGDYIAVLAGSRGGEISCMMPVCMKVADALHALPQYADYKFIVAGAPARTPADYEKYAGGRDYVEVVFGKTYSVLKGAKAAIINSGTASLEAALLKTPQVVGWSTSAVTAFIGRKILRVFDHVKYISLGNLIIDKLAFRELIQEDLTAENIVAEVRRLIEDEKARSEMLADYDAIRETLGGGGASREVAAAVIREIRK